MDEGEVRIYEVGFLLSPLIPADQVGDFVLEKISQLIKKVAGEVVSDWPAHLVKLAYPVGKVVAHHRENYREAYFGALRFSLASSNLAETISQIKALPELIRLLCLVDVPTQMISARPLRHEPSMAVEIPLASEAPILAPEEIKPVMTTADIDKEIDQLLAQV